MNIHLSENGHSCVADSRVTGSHWVCIYFRFKLNLWLYAHSLGYAIADNLFQHLGPFKNSTELIYDLGNEEASLIMLHSHMFPGNKNCAESCIKYFPFQGTDMNICGAATILSAIILTRKCFYQAF